MRSPLNKRLFRELRGEFGKYLVIFILMTLTIGMVSGFLVADGSMLKAYEQSFANPSYAVQMLGEGVGQILSFIYTEIRGMIVYAFEGREEELLIHMELFLQIHSEYADGE